MPLILPTLAHRSRDTIIGALQGKERRATRPSGSPRRCEKLLDTTHALDATRLSPFRLSSGALLFLDAA